MNRIFRVVFLCLCTLLVSCTSLRVQNAESPVLSRGQTVAQLHLSPVRHETVIGTWLPYFTVFDLFSGGDAGQARERVHAMLLKLKAEGINTVFVHAVPFGEAVYPSAYYPHAPEVHGLDALRIFSEECMRLGLSLHVWLNPLRLQTPARLEDHPADTVLSAWYQDEAQREENLALWDGRYYLNPASSGTTNFLADAVRELTNVYHPAGIHIDDYFYPTQAPEFDEHAFLESGEHDLAAWRRSNITAIVRAMYRAVHENDAETVFSVSPQGDPAQNYEKLYADIPRWLSEGGCCDALIPQVYFGYENTHNPFRETVAAWKAMPRNPKVALMIGLAAYKVGNEDVYAGDGREEWEKNPNLLAQQIAEVLADPELGGAVLYHADAVLNLPESARTAAYAACSING